MDKKEFKDLVISEDKKYLFPEGEEKKPEEKEVVQEVENKEEAAPAAEDEISPGQIQTLAEEISKLSKKLDFRNPLLTEEDESLVETIISENKEEERPEEVQEEKEVITESETWKRLVDYKKFTDEGGI